MGRELHLHSMVVHAVIAFAVVAAAAFAFDSAGATVAGIAPGTWAFLWRASLLLVLLAALPATLTGITERSHMYVNWHRSHKAKLVLSLLLLALTVAELVAAARLGGRAVSVGSPLGLAVVAGNPVVCLALSFYGLRISLGRQAVARASYVPDMLKTPPVDVLAAAAAHVAERARVIEVMEEGI
ncbi:MAG: hypothetical protein LAO05_04145 [Acidobacteriia bacterium]|nr:hypothetical protein [Terriglobia bacterium]